MSTTLTPDMVDLLHLHAMGLLDPDETIDVEILLEGPDGDEARLVLHEAREAFGGVGEALEPVSPSAGLLVRLMQSTAEASRFERFVDQMKGLLDLSEEKVRGYLDMLDDPSSWLPGPSDASWLIHIDDAGDAVTAANVGFVKVRAGTPFPHHTHEGAETVLVLQGGYRDSDGSLRERGDFFEAGDGTDHDFCALEDGPDLIFLVFLERGVAFDFAFDL